MSASALPQRSTAMCRQVTSEHKELIAFIEQSVGGCQAGIAVCAGLCEQQSPVKRLLQISSGGKSEC
jgi:hypothetical protein